MTTMTKLKLMVWNILFTPTSMKNFALIPCSINMIRPSSKPRQTTTDRRGGELIYVCYFFTMLICMLNKLKPCCIGKTNLLCSAPVAALANLPPSIIENFFAQLLLFWRVSPNHIICILRLMTLAKCVPILKNELWNLIVLNLGFLYILL